MSNNRISFVMLLGVALTYCLLLSGCSSSEGNSPNAASLPPPSDSVIKAGVQDVTVYREYPAQTYARDMVEIRGRVDGYVEKRLFDVGADVKPGQPLYILDLRPYQAEVQKAHGDVAESEANLEFAKRQV